MPDRSPSVWLLDGNVLAIAVHAHHRQALQWFDAQSAPFATCAITQGTLLRLHLQLSPHPASATAWASLRDVWSLDIICKYLIFVDIF